MAFIYSDESNPWIKFWVGDSSNAPVTGLTAASFSSTVLTRDNLADTSLTLSDASGPTDWAAGKLYEVGSGYYKVGVATASISSFTGDAAFYGVYASGTVFSIPNAIISPERGTDSANTTTPPTAAAIRAEIDTNSTQLLAIEAETDGLQALLAGIETKVDTVDGIVDSILVDTGTTLPASLSGLETKVDTIDGIVDAILVDTGTTIPGLLTTISTAVVTDIPTSIAAVSLQVTTVDTVVDAILVDTGTTLPASLSVIDGKIDTADTVIDNVYVEIQKIPRSGSTYRYTQVASNSGSQYADVSIGATS